MFPCVYFSFSRLHLIFVWPQSLRWNFKILSRIYGTSLIITGFGFRWLDLLITPLRSFVITINYDNSQQNFSRTFLPRLLRTRSILIWSDLRLASVRSLSILCCDLICVSCITSGRTNTENTFISVSNETPVYHSAVDCFQESVSTEMCSPTRSLAMGLHTTI
jgi:hypothetical protein